MIKAIWVSSEGFSTSFRTRDNGVVTSILSKCEKDTCGMTLLQIATKAKQKGFHVESFTDEELSLMDKATIFEERCTW